MCSGARATSYVAPCSKRYVLGSFLVDLLWERLLRLRRVRPSLSVWSGFVDRLTDRRCCCVVPPWSMFLQQNLQLLSIEGNEQLVLSRNSHYGGQVTARRFSFLASFRFVFFFLRFMFPFVSLPRALRDRALRWHKNRRKDPDIHARL